MARSTNNTVENNDKVNSGAGDNSTPDVANVSTNNTVAKDQKSSNNGLGFTVKDGMVDVVCKTRAGKTIYAASGKKIVFDDNGNASVEVSDALYLNRFKDVECK